MRHSRFDVVGIQMIWWAYSSVEAGLVPGMQKKKRLQAILFLWPARVGI